MNLLISLASIKQSLLGDSLRPLQPDSSGGESDAGWAGVESGWPTLVKTSSESQEASREKEKWPRCYSHGA